MTKLGRMEKVASIVVLASIVIAALIADIVGTAVETSRVLGAIGLLSLLGLVRHGYILIHSYQVEISQLLESEELSSGVRARLIVEHNQRTH